VYLGIYSFNTKDTAGQEKFNALTPIYYRGAKAAVLVYDVTLGETFKKVKKWIAELREFNKEANTIAIAGNKIDIKKFDINKDEILK
jgi:small GTP-binding protein